jgi:hypothetical protein
MRFLSLTIATVVFVAAIVVTTIGQPRASATDYRCRFNGKPWVDPDVHQSGNLYQVVLNDPAVACAQAVAWAKKLMAQSVSGAPLSLVDVKGGPPGYQCTLTIDGTGHSHGGACKKPNGDGFAWMPFER